MDLEQLIKKYNTPVPRYTSYPTVPYWQEDTFSQKKWISSVNESFKISNKTSGISIYIHLPYCESLCTYCGCNTRITKNHTVERPYLDAVIKEWELYKNNFDEKPIIKELHLGGGTPTFFSAENLKYLLEHIFDDCELHKDAAFSFEAHPENTTATHLQTLFSFGFRRLSLGIQDFDEKVQQIINRRQSFKQVEAITLLAREIGYTSVNYDLIYGLPLQNISGLVNTLKLVNYLKPDRIAFYSYAHVPWVKPGQRMFTELDLPDNETKQLLYETGRKSFIDAGYEEVGMDHFSLPSDELFRARETGKLHRNFMGYTHQYTQLMIGLGVSSISDTWNGFAQNVKTIEEYKELIAKDIIPVFKGHILTEEDLLMREHILSIMCTGYTSWTEEELLNDCFALALENLEEAINDQLVIKQPYNLQVTDTGKRFLRNICAAFDIRLWKNKPEKQLFSLR